MARLHPFSSRVLLSSLFAVLLSVNVINAETLNFMDTLPACAKDCAVTAATDLICPLTDGLCLCGTRSFTSATLQCSTGTCGVEDQILAIGVLGAICDSVASSSSSSSSIYTTPVPSRSLPTEEPSMATSTPTTSPTSSSSIAPASSPTPIPSLLPPLSESSSTSSPSTPAAPTPAPASAPPPISTVVVLVTSTMGYDSVPTLNAAMGGTGAGRVGAVGAGAAVVGMLALL
ncbi:hypothetical protein FPV67DRAFT_1788807 [Lyophyllum atratum]|nr:hypothetical protein FPV67DRAFT_1788807 [Lyophyllum atratum]